MKLGLRRWSVMLCAFAALFSTKVMAAGGSRGWSIGVDANYSSAKAEATSSAEATSTYYDVRFGNSMPSGLYLGALYATRNDTATASTSTKASAFGPSLGYDFGTVLLNATYLISATDGNYSKGTGTQFDAGWRAYLGSSFFMGFKMAYRSIKFTENSSTGTVPYTLTEILPYISLGWSF